MRKLKKALKYLFMLIVLLVGVIGASCYYFLGTNTGLQQAVNLANRYSGYQVKARSIDGNLLSRSQIRYLRISGENLDFTSENIVFEWQPKALLDKSLVIKNIIVEGTSAVVKTTTEKQPQKKETEFSLNDIELPIDIQVENVFISDLKILNIKTPDSRNIGDTGDKEIVIDKIQLSVDYIEQKAVIHTLQVQAVDSQTQAKLAGNLTGTLETKGNFPLHLQSSGTYHPKVSLNDGQQQVDLEVDGALKQQLNVAVKGSGAADFQLDGALSALFGTPTLAANLSLQQFDGNRLGIKAIKDISVHGALKLAGSLGKKPTLNANGEIFYDSPDTDKIKLTLDGHFDGNRAELSLFKLDLLTAKQQLTGQGGFSLVDKQIDIAFAGEELFWPQSSTQPVLTLKETMVKVTGTLDDYELQIQTRGNTAAAGKVEVNINARGNTAALKQFDAKVKLNGDPLTLSGEAQWQPTLQYRAQMKAEKISPFNRLPGIERLAVRVNGDTGNYNANGGVYVYADNIPPSEMTFAVSGSPSRLDKADVNVETLGGEITVNAHGGLSPPDIIADVVSKNIQPQQFYTEIDGNINQQLRLTAKQNGSYLTAEGIIKQLSGQLQGYPLAGQGAIRFEQAANLVTIKQLALDLAGNRLKADGVLMLDGNGDSNLQVDLDARHLDRLLPDLSGKVKADITAKGTLRAPELTAKITANELVYQTQTVNAVEATANVHVNTSHADKGLLINGDSVIFYDSPNTDKIRLSVNGNFDGQRAELSALTVDLLTAKQQLTGQGSYTLSNKNIAVKLDSEALHWPQNATAPDMALKQTAVSLTGSLDNYHLAVSTRAKTPMTGDVPLTLTADGNMSALRQFVAHAQLNGKPLKLDGNAAWSPQLAYQVRLRANEISPQHSLPGFKKLDIRVDGDDKQYRINGGGHLYADNIPPADIQLAVDGTPKQLNGAELNAKMLGGKIHIRANGALSPLNLMAKVNSDNLQPQRFYPGVDVSFSEQVTLTAKQEGEHLTIVAVLEKLNGKLQQYPLSGKGEVRFEQANNQLAVKGLSINLAGNTVKADGMLALGDQGKPSDLQARIHAPQLKRLLPDLAGAITADIALKGRISQPAVDASISGTNLAYQSHRAKTVKATAKLNLAKETLKLNADVKAIQSGKNNIDRATVNVDGKFAAHRLRIHVVTPKGGDIPSLKLAGRGQLDQNNRVWNGKLTTLNISNKLLGQWGLAKATTLSLSEQGVGIKQLCLRQKKSSLCADGEIREGKGDFKVALKGLATRQFKSLMPDTVDIDTSLSGKATIKLRDGKPDISGKISANGGRLSVNAGGGSLVSTIRQLETAVVLKNNRLKSVVQSRWSKLGRIDIAAEVPNLSQGKVKANIKIDNQSLQFVEGLVPQLSNVSGRLSGDMTVSGNPAKSLQVAGKLTLHKTDFNVPQFGSKIRDLTLDIFAKNANKIGFKGRAGAGGGKFNISGEVDPATRRGNIHLQGKNFQIANSNKLQVAISPDIRILLADRIKVRGNVLVPKALIIPESTGSKVTVSDDVVLPGQQKNDKKTSAGSPVDVEISVKLGDDVRVASADIETRLLGGIKINAKPGKAPKATGSIAVETGELRIYGQMLNIERGRVIFSNGPIANPSLDIRTTREIDDDEIIVGANILGTVQKPEISLFSTPSMADSSILSYLLFGRAPNSDSFGTAALLQTGGMVGANTLARDLRSSLGLDVLDFTLTGMEAGKNLTKALYVGMQSDFFSAVNKFLLNYKISGRTRLESAVSADEMSLDLIKVIETD